MGQPGAHRVAATEGDDYAPDDVARVHAVFDLATWQARGDEVTQYCYRHMTEFFPHALIPRSGDIAPLPARPAPQIAEVAATTPLGRLPLHAFLQQAPVDGFIVLHQGHVAYEVYPRMRPSDKHLWWSVSKTLASLLITILRERGAVDVRQPIDTYLPELRGSGWDGVAVQDILDMASGIDCLESDDPVAYTDPQAPFYTFEGTLGMLPPPQRAWASTYHYLASLPRLQAPGQVYQYTSVDTCVLGWLAERLAGTTYAGLVQREIWSHVGAEADAAIVVSPTGIAASHGGVSATLRDLARYGMLYTPSWPAVSAAQVVSDAYLQAIQTGGRPELLAAMGEKDWSELQGERPRHSTDQWDVVMADGDFFKAGYCGQGLWISPARDLVIAYFGHAEAADAAMTYARAIAVSGLFAGAGAGEPST